MLKTCIEFPRLLKLVDLPLLVVYPGRALVFVSGAVGCVFHRHDDGCDDVGGGGGDGCEDANVGIRHSVAYFDVVGLNKITRLHITQNNIARYIARYSYVKSKSSTISDFI